MLLSDVIIKHGTVIAISWLDTGSKPQPPPDGYFLVRYEDGSHERFDMHDISAANAHKVVFGAKVESCSPTRYATRWTLEFT